MIALDELLIKIGIDGSQAQQINTYVNMLQNGADNIGANAAAINDKIDVLLNDVSESLGDASEAANKASKDLGEAGESAEKTGGKFSKLKLAIAASVGALMLFGNRIASSFNAAIDNAKTLFQSKNALYQISQEEIKQVDRYKQSLERTSLSIDSVKTKIAINLIPTLTAVSEKFNNWLVINKDFVTNGITKVVSWLGKGIQVVTNFIKFIDKIVSSTIGWKNALIVLGVAWAILNRAFLFSPVGMIITAFGALLLLIDDLMVYMEGGKSLFGTYWDPLIEGGNAVVEFFKNGEKIWKPILIGMMTYLTLLGGKGLFSAIVGGIKSIGTAFKVLKVVMMSNPIIAILTAIATVAYLIYDNWEWLSTQFKKIWKNITGFAENAWNEIVSAVSNAVKSVLIYFGMTEADADATIESIKKSFEKVLGYITAPFEAAVNFVKDLFKIWEDDNTSFTDKVGKTFSKVTDLIKAPFQAAMKWIDDTFMKHIRGALGWVEDALSAVGFDVDLTGKEANKPPPQEFFRYFNEGVMNPNAPPPHSTSNQTVNNNQAYKTAINIHTTDTVDGVKRGIDSMERQIEKINIGTGTSFGSV